MGWAFFMSAFIHWLRELWLTSLQNLANIKYFNKRMNFSAFVKHSDTFIETGTHIGESVQSAIDAGFTNIKTVELQAQYYQFANNRFAGKNVKLYFGKSIDMLPLMLEGIPTPSVFWLDAHPAGPNTAGHQELLAGDQEFNQTTILKKELSLILQHGKHVILIDDINNMQYGEQFIELFEAYYPKGYTYELADEERSTFTYVQKVLICLPV